MPQQNSAMFQISDEQANYARKVSANMSEALVRKKGLIEVIGIANAVSYFSERGFKVNILRSLHKISEIFEEFKISDFYINNYRLDAITLFRDNKIKIPAAHLDYECAPDYYVIVQISDRIKEARVLGFLKPYVLNVARREGEYLVVDNSELKNIEELKVELRTPAYPRSIEGKHLECIGLFLRFVDGELATTSKKFLIKHLLTCPACLKKLSDVLEFNKTVREISNLNDVMQKYCSKPSRIEEEALDMLSSEPQPQVQQEETINLPFASGQAMAPEVQKKFKNIIDGIFDDGIKIEPSKMTAVIGNKGKKMLITFVCICLFLLGCTLIAIRSTTSNISSISDVENSYSKDSDYSLDAQADFANSHNLPQEVYGNQSAGVDYSLASQVTGEPVVATINKISWEVPENLANKANYKRFLQLVGKNIKLNLQNDLLLSNDFAKNNVIKLNIRIASSGDVIGMKIIQSSGSDPIDNIIKKSVSETLSYMKPPSHGLIARPVDVTLVINL